MPKKIKSLSIETASKYQILPFVKIFYSPFEKKFDNNLRYCLTFFHSVRERKFLQIIKKRIWKQSLIILWYDWWRLWHKTGSEKRVLVFHEVVDGIEFEKRLRWLMDNYQIVTMDELLGPAIEKKTQIAITFDDGYKNAFEVAAPILKKYNVPAIFFVCSGALDLTGERAGEFCKNKLRRKQRFDFLSWPEVREIDNNPLFEIGCHTLSHGDLGVASENEARLEIETDKKTLERSLGKKIKWFAYPFGQLINISESAREIVNRLGFKAAFMIRPAAVQAGDKEIGRSSLSFQEPLVVWRARLAGALDKRITFK